MQRLQIFEPLFNNDELDQEFQNFFYKNGLTPLFTNEHRAGTISVTYVDAKSVVNKGGAYQKILKKFSDYLVLAQDNKSYEEAIFEVIYKSRTFQKLINNIKKVMDFIDSQIDNEHMFNTWNIVFYTKSVY